MTTPYLVIDPPAPETGVEFALEVVRDTIEVARVPIVAVAAATISLAGDVTMSMLAWPFGNPDAPGAAPPEPTISVMACVILAKAWLNLTVCHMGLACLRNEPVGIGRQWVSVQAALRIGIVNLALVAGIVVGTLVLVLPGVYLMAIWSQAPLAMVDGRSRWFDAANYSASLTDGYKFPIIWVWLVVLTITTAVGLAVTHGMPALGLGGLTTVTTWTVHAVEGIVGAALASALYYNLDDRAPWNAPVPLTAPVE